MTQLFMCNESEVCLKQSQRASFNKNLDNWDGSYPDPIDFSPCDNCPKSK